MNKREQRIEQKEASKRLKKNCSWS